MQRICLAVPIQVGHFIQIQSINSFQDGISVVYEWGESSGGMDFRKLGEGSVSFPSGPEVDAIVSGAGSQQGIADAVLALIASGTPTAPQLAGTVETVETVDTVAQ